MHKIGSIAKMRKDSTAIKSKIQYALKRTKLDQFLSKISNPELKK